MAMDYHERRFASRNRPKRNSIWGYVLGATVVLLLVYAGGVATGWFAHHRYGMKTAMPPVARTDAGQGEKQALPAPPASGTKTAPGQTPLTFYETLPQGSKSTVIGSGINPAQPFSPPVASPKPAPAPQPQPQPKPAPADKPAAPQAPPAAAAPPAKPPQPPEKPAREGERRFTVQVASVKEKAEAESLKARMAARGLNPYVIAVDVPGKGLLYRVRAGRRLLQSEAQEIAAKLGSGAIVVPE